MAGKNYIKRLASKLPDNVQLELKRIFHGRQIQRGDFGAGEPETAILTQFIRPGDWVVDVGANIGNYAWQFSNIVGPQGRVVAVEPIPQTFALLAANVQKFPNRNVSLLNVALSDQVGVAAMFVPLLISGLRNYYQASLERHATAEANCNVLTLAFDQIGISHPIALIKIDAEGHDERVIAGMLATIERDKPVLIVEDPTAWTRTELVKFGYSEQKLPGSPNTIFTVAKPKS